MMLMELQENTEKQFHNFSKTVQEKTKVLQRDRKQKKNETEILQLINTMTQLKKSIESFNIRLDQTEETITQV